MNEPTLTDVMRRLDRIEAALAALINSLAAEEDPADSDPGVTLDGHPAGRERSADTPL